VPVLAPLILLIVAGCGSGPREDAAAAAAQRFAGAVRDGDQARGCALLAPPTREELEKSQEMPCPQALGEEELPELGEIRQVEVYGHAAEVRGKGDTVFLTDLAGDWRVVAAGCTPRRDRPYDCTVKGA
jgi:hypothetical protein